MEPQRIFSLFGHSTLDPDVKKLFSELGIPEKPQNTWHSYTSDRISATMQFSAFNNYKSEYGEPVKRYTDTFQEAFLSEVTFDGWEDKAPYPYPLPFDLKKGDTPGEASEKIKLKPAEKRKTDDGSRAIFFTDALRVMVAFDLSEKLEWVRVWPLTKADIRKRELKKNLRSQKKNITANNIHQFEKLDTPIKAWAERMKEGDSMFTQANIAATGTLLDNFKTDLITAAQNKKPGAVLASVKKVVKAFNKINNKYESFIETLEREELADYIHKAVAITGFAVEKDTDLTEEWREW